MNTQYDVIVIGGGTAGTVAAIQAGGAGARTLLIEKNGMLGGTMTVAGVNFPGLFFARGKQVLAGIGWELICKTLNETGDCLPDMTDPTSPHWRQQIPINIAIFAALADHEIIDAGVDLLFHAMPARIHRQSDTWHVDACTKSGLQPVTGKVLVDCSGDANAVSLAGFRVERAEPTQPGTLALCCSGYDPDTLDIAAIDAALEQALKAGRIRHTDIGWQRTGTRRFLERRGRQANHISTGPADLAEGKTRAEIAARQSMLRMFRFFRSQLGLERFRIEQVASECGIRESVVIRGKGRITGQDYMSGRLYDDAVCYCYYPIDIHLDDGEGIDLRPLPDGAVPTIPRSAMLPADSEFLLVAGRCISGDREAQSAFRVQAACMAMGQAAGVMAALSARSGVDPEQLAMDEIRSLLREHGAIVPGP